VPLGDGGCGHHLGAGEDEAGATEGRSFVGHTCHTLLWPDVESATLGTWKGHWIHACRMLNNVVRPLLAAVSLHLSVLHILYAGYRNGPSLVS
jgi:hypothetical protein